jgi:hypothetical protein
MTVSHLLFCRQRHSAAVCLCLACQVFSPDQLPDTSCSKQWSISANLDMPSSFLNPPEDASGTRVVPLMSVLSSAPDGEAFLGWPHVLIKVSPSGVSLVLQWGDSSARNNSREQPVTLKASHREGTAVDVVVIRDGNRLGVWVNSAGGWVLEDVWCVPESPAVSYCMQPSPLPHPDSTLRAVR